MNIRVGIADDQQLFLKSLSELINRFKNFSVAMDSLSGEQLIERLQLADEHPDIILLDVNMPGLGGLETARVIVKKFPEIKIVALSMKDDDTTIIKMLRAGCCAYLLKDIHPLELEKGLREVYDKGYYNADVVNVQYRRLIIHGQSLDEQELTDRELTFLKHACSDLTYKQIAAEMNLATRTIDGYRESLFRKFNVQSRVGMALEAIRRELVLL